MGKWEKVTKKRLGFTIVELLTVMGVIAILIGLLVPALNLVRDYAKELQQAAQFHSIEVAIDMFVSQSGYGNYPPSTDNMPSYGLGVGQGTDIAPYSGAQKLAEALVGWDLLGYHPQSSFRSDGSDDLGNLIYDTNIQNLEQRKEQFIELENANAFMIGDIYSDLTGQGSQAFNPDNYVLCDVYAKKRTRAINGFSKKTGMPILYYKARTRWYDQTFDSISAPANPPAPALPGDIEDDIYYYPDNENIMLLGDPDDSTIEHPLSTATTADNLLLFEIIILNDEVTTLNVPYRAGSFILISAGKDGLYGTSDDLMNFNKER